LRGHGSIELSQVASRCRRPGHGSLIEAFQVGPCTPDRIIENRIHPGSIHSAVNATPGYQQLTLRTARAINYRGGASLTQLRHTATSVAIRAGPRKIPMSTKDSTPPRMPSNTHRNGSFAPSPMMTGRTK
jgi:hypothetical protein